MRYRKTPDRSTVALGFRQPRLVAGRVGLAVQYENRSDGRLGLVWRSDRYVNVEREFGRLLDDLVAARRPA